MRKKLLAIIMMCFCVISLCGCASVSYANIIFSDGSIEQQIVVVLDNDKISSAGLTVSKVENDICEYANMYYNQLSENCKNEVNEVVWNIVCANNIFKISVLSNKVVISLKFNDIDSYYYFYQHKLPEKDDTDGTLIDYGFYQKDISSGETVFYNISEKSYAVYWLNYFKSKMPNVTFDDCDYYYTYSTPYEKIHSDADNVYADNNGNTSHTWVFSAKDLTGENATTGGKITLYTVNIKSPLWYIVAVGATVVIAGVLYLVCAIKDSKNKKVFVDTQSGIDVKID